MSIRWYIKILLAFLLIIAVVIIPSTFYLGINLKNFLMAQKEQELKRELQLAAFMVSDHLRIGQDNPLQIRSLANQIGTRLQRRVTIISKDGRLLGDSELGSKAIDKSEDHSYRPEILEAKTKGFGQSIRFSTTTQANTLYGAVLISREGNQWGYIRLALPLNQIDGLVADLRSNLVLAGSLTGLLAILLSFFLTWKINRPLREITDMVKKMADGDLKQPFHLLPKSEFSDLTASLEHMADELIEKIESLDTETGQLKTLLSTMQEGVLIMDEKGRIILMNLFLEEVLGEKRLWKKRTTLEVFMDSKLQEAIEVVLQGNPFKRLHLPVGHDFPRYFEVHVVPLTSIPHHRRVVALFHETTELEHLLKVRQDFVANASHELRTPLTSISGYMETLLSLTPADPPEFQRFLSIIQKNVKRLNLLVSDLLDLAKLDAKEIYGINFKKVGVVEILNTAVQMVGDQARDKGIALSMETADLPEDLTAFWEPDRVVQALVNILDNAIKYTPQGGHIRLTVTPVQRSAVSGQGKDEIDERPKTKDLLADFVEISIEDNGIGIPKEHLSRIFERFYRIDKDRSRELGGTGLGLAIVKHIVDSYGGTIQVQSTINKGSTFKLTFPLQISSEL